MKFRGAKVKLSRSLGIPLTPKAAKYMERRPYGPGEHGPPHLSRRTKMSPYKQQLIEKQRLRAQYNIHERQMVNYYKKAAQKSGNTGDNLIAALESRLDAVVLRGGLANSIYAARQFVNHGHIQVNGKRVNIPAFSVSEGDVVSVRERSRKMLPFAQVPYTTNQPPYVAFDKANMAVKFIRTPEREEIPTVCEVPLVVEFYSK
jgi:small subunit ribosomal protein S4